MKRKDFLRQITAAGAASALLGFDSLEHKWLPSFQSSPAIIDLHAHPGVFYLRGLKDFPGDEGIRKTVNEMNQGGLTAAFVSTVVDRLVNKRTDTGIVPAREFEKGEAWREYRRQVKELNELCGIMPMRKATTLREITDRNTGKTAIVFACEGGDFLESADQLDEIYNDGVRAVQLVHYAPNPLGDLQTYESQHNGLSATGKSVVKRMNELGMLVDVAHAAYDTVKDVVDTTDKPIVLSHSILKLPEERPISIRAITPEHAKLVASTGGVIGAWPSGFSTSFDDYINNIMRLIDTVGVDHVGLGTDMDSNYKPVLDSYLQLPKWLSALQDKGLSKEEVAKVAGGNVVRVLSLVLK
ncbi:MAG: dipeptidase [Cyclobacteriaceae bacterium]